MEKRLTFRRIEYVKEYYEVTWTEKDYQDLINFLSTRTDTQNVTRYEILKDLSFDDICKIFNNEADDIKYELICQNGADHQWSYTEYIGDYIRDMLREDCWNMGCYDSECDDSEEDCEVIEVNKQEFIS